MERLWLICPRYRAEHELVFLLDAFFLTLPDMRCRGKGKSFFAGTDAFDFVQEDRHRHPETAGHLLPRPSTPEAPQKNSFTMPIIEP